MNENQCGTVNIRNGGRGVKAGIEYGCLEVREGEPITPTLPFSQTLTLPVHGELPAGRVDIVASAAADGDGDALGHERLNEAVELLLRGALEI